MQNFTLGKKVISMLFFAFFLLIGSTSSFGQENCPTVSETTQEFCYLARVSDLEATPNGDPVRWYRTATSQTPISENELLQDGTYFAGNQSRTCTSGRTAIEVIVDEFEEPEAQFGVIFSPCVAPGDENDATVQDLISNVNGNDVEVFAEEFGENALSPSEPLAEGESYFVGQRNPDTDCRSLRIAIRYEPLEAPAPTGEAVQTFCPTATVADLVVESTSEFSQGFRIYATLTSSPALSNNTPLVNGETYFVSQIVNREGRNQPPCESTNRFEIEVSLEFEEINENDPVVFCIDDETSPTVADLEARTGFSPFFADEDFTVLLEPSTSLGDGEDYFTANGDEETCIVDRFVVVLQETIDLGDNIVETACSTEFDNPLVLAARFAEIISRIDGLELNDIDEDNFSNSTTDELLAQYQAFISGTEPSNIFSTTFTIIDGECSSSVDIDLTVIRATPADAGEIEDQDLCQSEEATNLFTLLGLDPDDRGKFTVNGNEIENGDFTPSVIDDFLITYTVDPENDGTTCIAGPADSEDFTITVVAQEIANAGGNQTEEFCEDETEDVDLNSLLGPDAIQGGTFTLNGEEITIFNPATSGVGEYEITYTISGECITGTDTALITVTVTALQAAEGGEDRNDLVFCENDDDVNLSQFLINATSGGTFSGQGVTGGIFSPATTGDGEFTITYRVTDEADCVIEGTSDTATFTITVNELADADAGMIDDVTVNCGSEELIVLASLPNEGGNTGGTFTGIGVENGIFDPSVGPGNYDITYSVDDSADCVTPGTSAETTFTIRVLDSIDLGEPIVMEMCITEVEEMLTNPQLAIDLFNDAVAERTNGDLSGDFNPSLEIVTGQIATYLSNPTPSQTFETTYSVSNACGEDSVLISLTINDVTEANAGDIADFQVCAEDATINLFDRLTDDSTLGGTFSTGNGEIVEGLFNISQAGEYTITYTVTDEADCVIEGSSNSATFTVTVLEPTEANAGGNQTPPAYCVTEDVDVELFTLLGDEANPFGTFELNEEEITTFNPADLGIGEFVITYIVDGENDCAIGTESATITITVTETPDAPVADANQAFCLIDNPTVADITVTGENVVLYEDEALTQEAAGTDPLANETVYYAVSTTGDNGCNSDAVMITISLSDGTAPTLQTEGNEFCRSDNPTVQDLINNLSGSGIQIYPTSTGGTALAASTALVDGTTYFASGTDAGCESSERLAVQVEVAFCGIPEAFSPNGDNKNDLFEIPDIATDFPNYTIEIFNRWGNVVFKGNSSTGDWDGISNQSGTLGDNVLAAGVYFYILNYNDGQTAPVQGKVYLSR